MATLRFIQLYTLLHRELTRIFRIWLQTIIPPTITTALYFMIFGHLIGNRIGSMGSLPYDQFIAPGLIMMGMINNSFSNVASSFFSEKFQHSIEELITSPVPYYIIVLGFISGGIMRGLLVGCTITLVAEYFTHVTILHPFLLSLTAILTTCFFANLGMLNGLYANRFDDIAFIPTYILTPMIYLGGVFYTLDLLSPFWYQVSLCNPILYLMQAFRSSMLDTASFPLPWILGSVALLNILLMLLNIKLLRRYATLR
jgi:ABC-2 type transport system permease protein